MVIFARKSIAIEFFASGELVSCAVLYGQTAIDLAMKEVEIVVESGLFLVGLQPVVAFVDLEGMGICGVEVRRTVSRLAFRLIVAELDESTVDALRH